MQVNAIYQRSMIQTMAGKAIRDLRSGGERELRNVMELCKGRFSSPGARKFWAMLGKLLRLPNQQYGALLSRAARDVELSCLKTLMVNLALHASAEGSDTLRHSWTSGSSSAYWLEPLTEEVDWNALLETASALQQQGTSSFLLRADREEQLSAALGIAARHPQCVFLVPCQASSCPQAHLEDMAALGNVIPLVRCQDLPTLAAPLKQTGLLFGFHRWYNEIESLEAEGRLLNQWIDAGCFLGIYEGCSPDPRDNDGLDYYAKLQELRRQGTKEILLGDLWRDREVVQKLLLLQQSLPDCSWNGRLAKTSRKAGA